MPSSSLSIVCTGTGQVNHKMFQSKPHGSHSTWRLTNSSVYCNSPSTDPTIYAVVCKTTLTDPCYPCGENTGRQDKALFIIPKDYPIPGWMSSYNVSISSSIPISSLPFRQFHKIQKGWNHYLVSLYVLSLLMILMLLNHSRRLLFYSSLSPSLFSWSFHSLGSFSTTSNDFDMLMRKIDYREDYSMLPRRR